MITIKPLLATFAWLLLALTASAERNIRIIYYQAPDTAPREAVLYGASGKYTEVNFPRYNLSNKSTLPDNGEQFILLPQKLAEDASPPANAPRVHIPLDWDLCVLLVVHDPNNTTFPIRIQPINASPSVFGPGESYWINLTDIIVGGLVGDKKLLLQPRSTKITRAPKKEISDYRVIIDCLTPGENKRRWLVRQTWRHNPRARQLIFIQPMNPPRIASLYSVSFY